VTDPTNPSETGFFETPCYALDVVLNDTIAYVADGTSGLRILNKSNPANIYEIGSCDTPGNASALFYADQLVYVADGDSLMIYDVADPSSPVRISAYDTPGQTQGVVVVDTLCYVIDWGTLRIYNVSNPYNPIEIGFCTTPGNAEDVAIQDTFAYVADGHAHGTGLQIINIANPASPFIVGGYDCWPGWARDAGMFDVGFYDTPSSAYNIAVSSTTVYVAAYHSGLQVYEHMVSHIDEDRQEDLGMHAIQLLQNPVTNDKIHLRLHALSATPLGFSIFNAAGQKVQDHAGTLYDAGVHDMVIPLYALPIGVYFLTLQGSHQSTAIKVIIAR
jgi:hypothetical protein